MIDIDELNDKMSAFHCESEMTELEQELNELLKVVMWVKNTHPSTYYRLIKAYEKGGSEL